MKFIDLFAGIGGFRYGLEKVGKHLQEQRTSRNDLRPKGTKSKPNTSQKRRKSSNAYCCVWSNEWNKYASQIYKKHYGEINTQDIRAVKPSQIPKHDLICAGFPCQSFSIAGKRKGFGDTRGTLFYEILRIARFHRTPYLFLENVKGLLNHDKGQTFSVILESLDELGYDCQWQVLNSKNFGVPQNRERVFIIGHLRGKSRPKVFPLREGGRANFSGVKIIDAYNRKQAKEIGAIRSNMLNSGSLIYEGAIMSEKNKKWLNDGKKHSRNFPQGQRVYSDKGIASTIAGNAGGLGGKTGLYAVRWSRTEKGKKARHESQKEGRDYTPFNEGHRELVRAREQISGCVTHAVNKDALLEHDMKIRRLTPTECSRLQSFPDNWTKHGVVKATPVMYNRGYANAEKENALKVLRVLRKAVDSDKGKRWGFTKSIALFEKEILQPQLYAKRLQGDLEKGGSTPTRELQSKAVDSCDRMFEMWQKEKFGYTPQRQKQIEQQLGELRSIVSRLPHEITQERGRLESTEKKQGQKRQVCFNWISDTQRYKCLGNAVSTPVITAIAKRLLL